MAESFGKGDEKPTAVVLTAAELMRRRLGFRGSESAETTVEQPTRDAVDLDEEIQRLEAALQRESDDDADESGSSSGDSTQSSGSSAAKGFCEGDATHRREILCLSTVKDDRIEALPTQYLPSNKKRTLKSIDREVVAGKPSKKRRRADITRQGSSGLEQAVKEVLEGYKPRSSERLPFYCRVCAKQYSNEADFFQHRQTDFHRTAAELERKLSYCKLCRKQLTSPAQLKEHLQSKPHKERLGRMQSNHRGRSGQGRA